MLYHLFTYLETEMNLSGASLFQFLSFRAAAAIILALLICLVFGGKLIAMLNRSQVKDEGRELGLEGEKVKSKTPTMGGLIILGGFLLPVILFCNLSNIYILLMIGVTLWLGLIGFVDDYIKVFKKDKGGLRARAKLIGQFGLGIIVGLVMFFHQDVVVRYDMSRNPDVEIHNEVNRYVNYDASEPREMVEDKAVITYLPFLKNTSFDYASVISFVGDNYQKWAWIIYIPLIMLIVTFLSNGCNITDGLDGLAAGVSIIIVLTLGALAYMSGNSIAANYLNLLYLPGAGELVILCAALIGACIGFMWYNANPAQVFMGDTGSLAIGGIIASLAIVLRMEVLMLVLCGVFIIENISVMLQVGYFKYTKKKYGEGRRIFRMAPLHHHYQKLGYSETKIVVRFWIVQVLLAALTLMILKIR